MFSMCDSYSRGSRMQEREAKSAWRDLQIVLSSHRMSMNNFLPSLAPPPGLHQWQTQHVPPSPPPYRLDGAASQLGSLACAILLCGAIVFCSRAKRRRRTQRNMSNAEGREDGAVQADAFRAAIQRLPIVEWAPRNNGAPTPDGIDSAPQVTFAESDECPVCVGCLHFSQCPPSCERLRFNFAHLWH